MVDRLWGLPLSRGSAGTVSMLALCEAAWVLPSVAGIVGKLLNVAIGGGGVGAGVAEEVDCCVYCANVARMAWRSGGCAMIEVRCVEESMLWRRRAILWATPNYFACRLLTCSETTKVV